MHHRYSERIYTRAVRARTSDQAKGAVKGLSEMGIKQLLRRLDNGARKRFTALLLGEVVQ
ncbi:MAG: hypothetical protein WC494_00840 [Candidatus Pacearchaeota archaeon]